MSECWCGHDLMAHTGSSKVVGGGLCEVCEVAEDSAGLAGHYPETPRELHARAQAAEAKLERVRELLATIDTSRLVALSQWLDIKFPGEVGKDREVQDSLIEWATTLDVACALLEEESRDEHVD